MTEWLTTGEMIDRLKVGEVAEGSTNWEVKRLEDGMIVELCGGNTIRMNLHFLNEKWRIHPNYVSFGEALEALKNGAVVRWYSPDGTEGDWLFHPRDYGDTSGVLSGFSLEDFHEGKWTIEEGV